MRDLRYAFRSLGRSKGFVAVAVISLGLALGLNTAVFAVLDAFMHPYVPYHDPEHLVTVQPPWNMTRISRDEFAAMIRRRTARYTESTAYHTWSQGPVMAGDIPSDGFMATVSPNFFSVLGLRPEVGRFFQRNGDERAAVISHRFWLRAFGGRRAAMGATVTFGEESYTVIGVVADGVHLPINADTWRVAPASLLGAVGGMEVIRLKPAVTFAEVEAELRSFAHELNNRYGPVKLPYRFFLESLQPDPYDLSTFHFALAGSALAILIIACANLANLMLARGVAKRSELALHLAIGASRGTLIRKLLLEAAMLALAGGGIGVLLALWGVSLARGGMPRMALLPLHPPQLSWRLFAFGAGASAFTLLLFGLLPAVRASDVDIAEPLKEGALNTTSRVRRYSILAITQVALALMLLMSVTVLLKSARLLAAIDFGYDTKNLYQAGFLSLKNPQIPAEEVEGRFDRAVDAAARVSGVRSAATVAELATWGGIVTADVAQDSLSRIPLPRFRQVSAGFLRTLGVPVVLGRDFELGDRAAGGAAMVDQMTAVLLWHGVNPIGQMIKLGGPRSPHPWARVVGVFRDARLGTGGDPNLPHEPQVLLLPSRDTVRMRTVIFRTGISGASLSSQVSREIQSAALLRVPPRVFSWVESFNSFTQAQDFAARVFGFLGVCGLGLAATGLYGVLAYNVSRRRREFGVRIALGATPGGLFRLVLRDGGVMFLAGTAVGAFVAMAASKLLDPLLYGVAPTEAVSLIIAESVLCVTAFVACLAPARRAMRADPVEILRAT